MFTVEFTGKGWAVFHNEGGAIIQVSLAYPGDTGRETAMALAAAKNVISKSKRS